MLGSTISGLMAANKGIDVTSNNISNGSTVGFKQSTVSYADIFPNDPSASPKTAIGAGVAVSSVNKNMSQGSISSSGKVTDIAITGNGFFVLGTAVPRTKKPFPVIAMSVTLPLELIDPCDIFLLTEDTATPAPMAVFGLADGSFGKISA